MCRVVNPAYLFIPKLSQNLLSPLFPLMDMDTQSGQDASPKNPKSTGSFTFGFWTNSHSRNRYNHIMATRHAVI